MVRIPDLDLNAKQIDRLSEICMGIGHISFASVVIPTLIDRFDPVMLTLSMIVAVYFWAISILFLRRKK